MVDFILSPIPIQDLVNLIADELESRIQVKSTESFTTKEENFRFVGDRAIAAYLSCSIQTVNALKRLGKLPFHRYGRKYYYIQSEVDEAFKGKYK